MNIQRVFYFFIIAGGLLGMMYCNADHAASQHQDPDDTSHGQDLPAFDSLPEETGINETYETPDRYIWQKPEMIINLMGNIRDKVVADIGAGSGFFSLRLAPQAKKVIAIEIFQEKVARLDSIKNLELPESAQARLESRLGLPDNPKIAKGEADIILIVNTYIYFPNRMAYVKNLLNILPEGGKLLIIDFKKKRTPQGPPNKLRIPEFQVEEELYQAGFKKVTVNDTALDYQYIVIAEK